MRAAIDRHAGLEAALEVARQHADCGQAAIAARVTRISAAEALKRLFRALSWKPWSAGVAVLSFCWLAFGAQPTAIVAWSLALLSGAAILVLSLFKARWTVLAVADRCTVSEANSALLHACNSGNTEVVRALLRDGRAVPHFGSNAGILCAAAHGHAAVVKLLLRDGRADPAAGRDGVLVAAAGRGHLAVVSALLGNRRVLAASNSEGQIALLEAARFHHWRVVLRLLDHRRIDPSLNWYALLVPLAVEGDECAVRACLAHSKVRKSKDYDATLATVLLTASRAGRLQIVEAVLAIAAAANSNVQAGFRAIAARLEAAGLAAAGNHLAALQRLLSDPILFDETSAALHDAAARQALVAAAEAGTDATLAWLLQIYFRRPGVSMSRLFNRDINQAVAAAAGRNRISTVDLLLDAASDADADRLNRDPAEIEASEFAMQMAVSAAILAAARAGCGDVISAMLRRAGRGADCVALEQALLLAAERGYASIVSELLAFPLLGDGSLDTAPLACACANGHQAVVALLLADRRIDPSLLPSPPAQIANARQQSEHAGSLPIAAAVQGGQIEVLRMLLAHPRVDPHPGVAEAAWSTGRASEMMELLLEDPRVDASAGDNFAVAIAAEAAGGHVDRVRLSPFQLLMDRPEVQQRLRMVAGDRLSNGLEALRVQRRHLSVAALRALTRRIERGVNPRAPASAREFDTTALLTLSLGDLTRQDLPQLLTRAWVRRRAAVLARCLELGW